MTSEAKEDETQEEETKATAVQAPNAVDHSQYQFWDLGTSAFRVAWLTLLVIHTFCAYFYIISGVVYNRTVGSILENYLNFYQISMKTDKFPTVAGIHYVFGVLHAIMATLMVVWSLYRRRFSFGPLQELAIRVLKPSSKVASRRSGHKKSTEKPVEARTAPRRVVGLAERVWGRLFARDGLFGVEGKYFEHLLMAREVLETTLQIIQLYRMSKYLARPWLNRFYLAILIINCWSAPLLHAICRRDRMKRRALALICDGVLDLMSAIGVSSLVMLSLYDDYDFKLGGFPTDFWYDDKWFVRTVTELQILLVSSWSDLCSRAVFSFGLLACLESIKEVLREAPGSSVSNSSNVNQASAPPATLMKKEQILAPQPSQAVPRRQSRRMMLVSSFRGARSTVERRLLQWVHGSFLLVGAVALGFHLHAESIPSVHECVIQVYPWGRTSPACLLLRLDCNYNHNVGTTDEVAKEWSRLDMLSVRRLVVTHCSALEVPHSFQDFTNIMAVKMYNTTINRWESDAAITATNHPQIVTMVLGRVNMSSGMLPAGLVSPDFPPQLVDVSFAYSNLNTVPDELATSWPYGAGFGCEVCQFTSIPKAALGINGLLWMTFARNPLTTFPTELFSHPSLEIINLAEISFPSFQLPDPNVFTNNLIVRLYLMHTNMTYLPKWVDLYVFKPRSVWYVAPIDLSGSPFCSALAELRAGTRDQFPTEWLGGVPVDQISDFMYLRHKNVSAIDGLIECDSQWTIYFPTEAEDATYSLAHT